MHGQGHYQVIRCVKAGNLQGIDGLHWLEICQRQNTIPANSWTRRATDRLPLAKESTLIIGWTLLYSLPLA